MKALSQNHLLAANAPPFEERSIVTRTIVVDGKRVAATVETSTRKMPERTSLAEAIAQLDAMHSDDDPTLISGNLNKRLRVF